jgi:hypothetical protein
LFSMKQILAISPKKIFGGIRNFKSLKFFPKISTNYPERTFPLLLPQ